MEDVLISVNEKRKELLMKEEISKAPMQTFTYDEAVDAAVVEKVEALKESTVAELTASLQEDYDAKVAAKMKQCTSVED